MNDWLDYKGSGSSRAYMGDTIAHSVLEEVFNETDNVTLMKQRMAYIRLIESLIAKANKLLDELESADKSVAEINATIKDKTRKDKNYDVSGLLQRQKTYLTRRATINAELEKTIKEAGETRKKMSTETRYGGIEYITELRHINNRRKLLLTSKYNLHY